MKITVVGLGKKPGDITRNGERAIKGASKTFVRTALTETVKSVEALGVDYISFDYLYESAQDFDALNQAICDRLISEAEGVESVCYCVDGSGVGDSSVQALVSRVDVDVVPGVNATDGLVTRMGVAGYSVQSAYDFALSPVINRCLATVIKDVDGAYLASEVKLVLADLVGEEEEVVYFKGDRIKSVKVCELDREEFSYDTGVIVPPATLTEKTRWNFDDLVEILKRLRGENGCPWDREQTHDSLRKNLIEETYELVEGIDQGDVDMILEETGDVLLQGAFHAEIGEETGEFTVSDVLTNLCNKLISRHEHVFGDVKAGTGEEALAVWENAKKKEKNTKSASDAVRKIARTLPALMRASKVIKIAQKEGLSDVAIGKDELMTSVESGDYRSAMLALICLMRRDGVDPEEALDKKLKEIEDKLDGDYGV